MVVFFSYFIVAEFAMRTFFWGAFSANPRQRLREYWRAVLGRRLDKRTAEEQDWMRCRLTCRVWTAFIGFGLSRILTQQLRVLFGGERQYPEIDATAIVMATAGFLLQLMPSLLNPRSLDPWYIVTSLLLNLTFVRSEIDAREVFILLHGLQMIVATLAKRTRCSIFCAGLTSAQILWMSQEQGIQFLEGEQQGPILLIFLIPIVLMCPGFAESMLFSPKLRKLGEFTLNVCICFWK